MVPDAPLTAAIVPGQLDDAARAAYAKAFDARRDTTGGLADMDACLGRGQLFDVHFNGRTVARYALQFVECDNGTEVFITAAAGDLPGADLVATLVPYIARQAAEAGAAALTINTRRRGLVKKLERAGWTLDAYVMRKNYEQFKQQYAGEPIAIVCDERQPDRVG